MSLKPREPTGFIDQLFTYVLPLLCPSDQPTRLPPSVAREVTRVVWVAEGPYFAEGALGEGGGEEEGDGCVAREDTELRRGWC